MRAAELLRRADVVIYDDLGAAEALEQYVPPAAVQLYVGKRGGRPSIKQPEIDALLVAAAAGGRTVVRLKGGCPSVFSRVSWAAHLQIAGCCVTSLLPCCAFSRLCTARVRWLHVCSPISLHLGPAFCSTLPTMTGLIHCMLRSLARRCTLRWPPWRQRA